MQLILITVYLIALHCIFANAGVSLLSANLGGGGGGMVKGSSFNLDTKNPRMTRVHGNGIKIDLELLEIATAGGVMRYSPTHVEFQKGLVRWISMFSDGKLSLHHNDKAVVQIYAPDESPYYLFSMQGNAAFRDIVLDKTLSQQMAFQLCIVDSVFDSTITPDQCKKQSGAAHHTVGHNLEALAKTILFISEKIQNAQGSVKDIIMKAVQETLIQPLRTNMLTMRDDISARVDTTETLLSTSTSDMNKLIEGTMVNMTALLDVQLGLIMDNASALVSDTNQTLSQQISSLQDMVESIINFTLQDIQNEIIMHSTALRSNISIIEDETIPMMRVLVEEEYKTHVRVAILSFQEEVVANMSSASNTAREWVSTLIDDLASNSSVQFAAINSSMTSADHQLRIVNASTTASIAELSAIVHDNITHIHEALTAIVGRNLSALTMKLDVLSANVAEEFQRWNGDIKTEMDTKHEDVSSKLESLKNSSDDNIETLKTHLASFSESTRNTTAYLRQLIDAGSEFSDMIVENTSTAIAKSNSILAKVIGEVNASLTIFQANSTEDIKQLSLSMDSAVSYLNSSFQSALENSVTDLHGTLSNMSLSWQESAADIHSNFSGRLNALDVNVTNKFNSFSQEFKEHVTNNTASLLNVWGAVHTVNESTIASLSEYSVSVHRTIDSLNTSLLQSADRERNMTSKEFAGLHAEVAAALEDVRAVISNIASVVFFHSNTDEGSVLPVIQTNIPTRSGNNLEDARQRSALKVDAVRLQHQRATQVDPPLDSKTFGRAESDPDPIPYTGLLDDDWEVYSIIQAADTQCDVLRRDLQNLSSRFQNQSSQTKNDMMVNALELSRQLNASELRVSDRISFANESLIAAISSVNRSLSLMNTSHEEKIADARIALQDLRSSLLDYMNTSLDAARINISTVAGSAWVNYTVLRDMHSNTSESIRNLAESRFAEYTITVADLNTNISQVNMSAISLVDSLNKSTQVIFASFNDSTHSMVNSAVQIFNSSLRDINVILEAQNAMLSAQMQSLNVTHLNDIKELNLQAEQAKQMLEKALTDTRNTMEKNSTAEYSRIYSNISTLDRKTDDLQRHTLDEFTAVNATIIRQQDMISRTDTKLTDVKTTQEELWTTHSRIFEGFVSDSLQNRSLLLIQAEKDKNELLTTIDVKVLNTSNSLEQRISNMNKSVSHAMDLHKSNAEMRLLETNSSLHSSISDVRKDLLSTRTLLEDSHQKEAQSIRTLITTTTDLDRMMFRENMTSLTKHMDQSLAITNSSLRSEMKRISDSVDNSLRLSLSSHDDMLKHFKTAIDGNVSLLSYRLSESENKLRNVQEVASGNSHRMATLSSELTQINSLAQTIKISGESTDSVVSSIQRRLDSNEASLHHHGNLTYTLHAQAHDTQQQLLYLSQNCSVNSDLLQHMLTQVNSSLSIAQERGEEMEARHADLSSSMAADTARITKLEMQVGGQSLPELKLEVAGVVQSQKETNRITSEAVLEMQRDISDLRTTSQEASTRLTGVEMRVNNIISHNLSAITWSVNAGMEKTSTLVEDLQSTLKRSNAQTEDKLGDIQRQDRENVQRLVALEVKVAQQERKIADLLEENERLRRVTASQDSVDDLRKLLQELQGSMMAQSSKVLDLVVANLASGKG